ncbi:MAG: hypothetical protein Q8S84_02840 [bacterium]|nr:hypothetical protein [bacterium]
MYIIHQPIHQSHQSHSFVSSSHHQPPHHAQKNSLLRVLLQ